ncbi:MAG TPA: cell division protein FtsA [Terriglobia bacterium]|nr:cell division protein FtsA [Terriglobia bacterium]
MARDYYIVGLDIGSTKTAALVCKPGESGRLEAAGLGVAESKGWRKGVIVNLDATVATIKKAVDAAESASGLTVDSAFVGVGGPHIRGVNSRGGLSLGRAVGHSREVTRDDISRLIQSAQGITLPSDRERIYVEQQEYLLDSQNGIRNPVGMVGSRLEVNVHLITASTAAHQTVVTAVNRAGIEVMDTVFEPLAGALACLTSDERELGVALADIGGGSTELIVYHAGTIRHTAVIPIGGDHFTNDIAVGLRTPIPEAEKMKRAWGDRTPSSTFETVLEVASVGDRPSREVSYAMLAEIIEPRSAELIELMQEELTRSGFEKQLGAGVVLVGGGAKLGGLAPLAEQILNIPVRVGEPRGLAKMGDILPGPPYAALIGLIAYGNRLHLMQDTQEKGWTGKLWGVLKGK